MKLESIGRTNPLIVRPAHHVVRIGWGGTQPDRAGTIVFGMGWGGAQLGEMGTGWTGNGDVVVAAGTGVRGIEWVCSRRYVTLAACRVVSRRCPINRRGGVFGNVEVRSLHV